MLKHTFQPGDDALATPVSHASLRRCPDVSIILVIPRTNNDAITAIFRLNRFRQLLTIEQSTLITQDIEQRKKQACNSQERVVFYGNLPDGQYCRQEQDKMRDDNACEKSCHTVPADLEMAAKILHLAWDLNALVRSRHLSYRTNGKFCHVRSCVPGVVGVDLPWRSEKGDLIL